MSADLAALARDAGMTVQLDGVIGNQHYVSVRGTLEALQRFGEAYHAAIEQQDLKNRARPESRANQPTEKQA